MTRVTKEEQDRLILHERARAKARSNNHARKLLCGQLRRHGIRSALRTKNPWR